MSRAAPAEIFAAVALAALGIAFGAREIRTPDAYFHLELGREILAGRAVPRTQRWLAFEEGRPFLDVEWGWQVLSAAIEARAGLAGVFGLRLALVFLAAAAVYVAARREGPVAAGLATLGFLLAAEGRFLDAPEIASIALAALFVAVLEARERFPRAPFLLVPASVLWANVHGFFPVGLALIAACAAGDLARRPRRFAALATLPFALAAPLLNPYGLEGALYPFRVLGDTEGRALLAERIIELRSALTDPAIATSWQGHVYRAGLAATATAAAASIARGFRLERLIALSIAVALSASHVRNVGLFAAIAAPLAALSAAPVLRALAERFAAAAARKWARGTALAAIALFALGAAGSVASGRWDADSLDEVGLGARFAPAISHAPAADFYLRRGLPRMLWTDFGTGHALIAESRGALRPAICGHTDLYSRELLRLYGDVVEGRKPLAELLARYPADAFFVDHPRLSGSALLAALLDSKDWALVYLDPRDAIFLRTEGATAEAARRLRVDLHALAADPERAFRFAEDARSGAFVRPRDRLGAALFFFAAGETAGAEALARRASEIAPGWPPCEALLGETALARGDLDAAKRHFRAAARAQPENAAHRRSLALIYLRLREYGRAAEEIAAAVALAPEDGLLRESLKLACCERAIAEAAAGRGADAERLYRQAIALDPGFADAHYNLGNVLFRAGRKDEAIAEYARACELAPRDAEARYNLGIALFDLGRRAEARAALEEALRLDPAHSAARRALAEVAR